MTTRSLTINARAAAAAAVLLMLVAGIAIASGGSPSLALFAGEDASPCLTDSTVPGADAVVPGVTDISIPCQSDADPSEPSSNTDDPADGSSTSLPPATTGPSQTLPEVQPPRSTTTRPTTPGSGSETDEIRTALRSYRTALQAWGRCALGNGTCGDAPTPDDFGITAEYIATLSDHVRQAVTAVLARAERRITCLIERANDDGTAATECAGPDADRTATDRPGSDDRRSEQPDGQRGEHDGARGTDDRAGDRAAGENEGPRQETDRPQRPGS